jgi:hypothetical protein
MDNQVKLLWVGNKISKLGGQNRVAYFTIRELLKLDYEVHCAGGGAQVLDEGESPICPCYDFNEHEHNKLYPIIDHIKPDIIILSHDVWKYYWLNELKQKYPHIPVIGWFTIDAHPLHFSWFQILRATDHVCVSTEFGKKTVYQRWPERGVEVVKYGVDKSLYNMN